jgi:hypothetical protein
MESRADVDTENLTLSRRGLVERLRALAFISVMTALPVATLFEMEEWHALVPGVWGAIGPLAWLAAWWVGRAPPRRGRVSLDGAIVRAEADQWAVSFARDEVMEARVEPLLQGCAIELWRRGGTVLRFTVGSLAEAHGWLDAADLALHRRVSRITLGASWHGWAFGVGYALVGMVVAPILAIPLALLIDVLDGPADKAAAVVLVWVAFTLFTTARAMPARVDVGTDGVLVRRGFSKRFIPYAALYDVRSILGDALSLHLRDGESLLLRTTRPGDGSAVTAAQALNYALERWHRARGADDFGLLERRGRAIGAWREAVGAMLAPQGAFRGVALDREGVLRVLEEPSAPAARRVGAALALADAAPEVRERVRVVIDGCADEGLRRALEGALDGSLDEATLARVEVSASR